MGKITIQEIKAFAHEQLGTEHAAVAVTDGEFEIVDPWYDCSGRWELNDEEAKNEWGEELVNEFIEKATKYLESR